MSARPATQSSAIQPSVKSAISRRTVGRGAAWAVPAITIAANAPAIAASTVTALTVSFDESRYGWPDVTIGGRTAKHANGVLLTVLDQSGAPAAGASVTLTIARFDDNSLWFFADPTIAPGPGVETAAPQLSTITLTADSAGQVDLDGYLWRGSDANSPDSRQLITAVASAGGVSSPQARALWAISSLNANFGNDDSGTTGPKDEAQHVRSGGGSWNF